ncbi:hypothetical protein CONPUDRAFT_166813 [Coniophora puteana RWD-64-598 SS2]|uniref:Carbohydrate-binding module family 13 protein n=1 Tax=Coniophora puteana (strain RWD-64-598) TaxID=741705 RepID=A0A5M3MJI9_CONPW|nr:uncharacterized protein CONPUDRAFT_166813 [Coniophora puteana RWD-64-598 SS2]EIW78964.1 hypothetical protein CONPUDRAFT_166813 [Coniophora puteana RWD-64-598 SS2]
MSIADHSSEATVIEEFSASVHSPSSTSSPDADSASMQTTPILPGTYLLLQFGERMAMDLTHGHTVIGYTKHERPNQQVRLTPAGDPGQEWTARRIGELTEKSAPSSAPVTTQSTYTVSSSEPAIRIEGAGSHPTIVINDRNAIPENGELVFTTTTTWSNTMTSTVTKFERILK